MKTAARNGKHGRSIVLGKESVRVGDMLSPRDGANIVESMVTTLSELTTWSVIMHALLQCRVRAVV